MSEDVPVPDVTPDVPPPAPPPPSPVERENDERGASSIRSWIRTVRRALALFFAGILAHEALDSRTFPPPPDPSHLKASFDQLSPAERRYHEKLRTTLDELSELWPELLEGSGIDRAGMLSLRAELRDVVSDKAPLHVKNAAGSLTIHRDRAGKVRSLLADFGSNQIELWPHHKDLRRTTKVNGRTDFHWTTAEDSLFGSRSDDGTFRSLFIEGEGPVDPKAPVDDLRKTLSTPHRLFLFQRIHWNYCDYTFVSADGTIDLPKFMRFLRHYRMSLAETQEQGFSKGACNAYAEVACETLHPKHPMHLLTFWPRDLAKRFREPWHTAAAFPMSNGEWCIVDGAMERLTYVPSPDAYGKEWDWEVATTPILGRLPWKPAPTTTERFLQHLHLPKTAVPTK